MKHYNPQKRQLKKLIILLILFIIFSFFMLFSTYFEREKPTIILHNNHYWNLTDPLKITIRDNNKIKDYKVVFKTEKNEVVLSAKQNINEESVVLELQHPQPRSINENNASLYIEAMDYSFWNFGNRSIEKIDLTIDKKPPLVTIVAHSFSISNGGSAVVVFEANDENIKDIKVVTKNGNSFTPSPFHKNGFYASLIARDILDDDFVAYVVATDLANNQTKKRVPLYYNNKKFRYSKIKLTDKFLNGKITDLYLLHNKAHDDQNTTGIDKFLFVNETLRKASNELIILHPATSGNKIDSFNIEPFHPLPNSAVVALFGDKREFLNDDKYVSKSFHLGLDLASVKEAKIFSSNNATVLFTGDNGIYGNTVILDHGFGLMSVYGHCTNLFVKNKEQVKMGQSIATTGVSGLALGDHLHFELRVGSIPVTPVEWMDRKWIKTNITKVLDDAKAVIEGREE